MISHIGIRSRDFLKDRFGSGRAACAPSLLGWAFLNDGHESRSRNFIARNDEGEFIKSTGEYLAYELIEKGDNFLSQDRFRGIDNKSYPSVKNLKRMFRRLGIEAVFTLVNTRLKYNAENDLKSFNSIRGSLAHSGVSGSFSHSDVKEQIQKMKKLVDALDKITFYHLRSHGSETAWKT